MKINLKSVFYTFFILNFILSPFGYALEGDEPLISMDLQDASLKDVMKILSIQSSLNFVASEAVQDRRLTLYLDNVPLKEAMNKIFKANNLSYEMDKEANIFIVNDWGKPTTQTVTKVFYLKHATVSSSSLKEEMKNTISGTGSALSSAGGSSTTTGSSSDDSSGDEEKGKWQVQEDAGITNVVKKLLSKDGSVIEDFRTNSLTVTDVPSRVEVISQVIASLDVKVPAIMMEVEMLDVSKDIVDNIGFKFGQTPLSVAITGGTANLGFPYHSWTKAFGGTNGSIDINSGSNGTSRYAAQLDFLRTQTDTKFLARPKILSLNNETAEIKIITNEAIGVQSLQEGQGSASSTLGQAERFETGISLRITPQIDLDSNDITMFIYPQVSEASTTSASFTSAGQNYTFRNPEIRSTKSTVRVKDGETVVLGGLIRNQNTTVITKLPILGDIPLLGTFFRHKNQSPGKDRELLVFITPHIIREDGQSLSPAKKMIVPQREQATVSALGRQQSISVYMNNFEAKR